MYWLTNEIIFYSGIVITGCAILLAILYFCVSKIKLLKLSVQLDVEYGEK